MPIVILNKTASCLALFVTYKFNTDLSHYLYVDFMEINSAVSNKKKNLPFYELYETYSLFKRFKKIVK